MSGPLNVSTENWGLLLRNGAGVDNAQPQSGVGSAYVNDIYIRAVGKWASQLATSALRFGGQFQVLWNTNPGGRGNPNWCWEGNPATGACTCPAGYVQQMVGMTFHIEEWDGAGFICWGAL